MDNTSFKFKSAILSISLVLVTGSSISAALPEMSKSLDNASAASVNLIATIPQAGVLLFLLLSGLVVRRCGIKNTILIGLITMAVSGLVPVITDNYWIILLSRFIFGAGIGLYNALAITIINLSFDGKEQSKLLGFRGSMESIGASIASLLVGILLTLGWHSAFLIYALALPIAFFFYKNVPDIRVPQERKSNSSITKVNGKVLVLAFTFLILVMTQIMIILQIPRFMIERHISSASIASTIVALNTFAGMLGGLVFGFIYNKLGKIAFSMFLFGDAIGLVLLYFARNIVTVASGTIIVGIFGTLMCVAIFNLMTNVTMPAEQAAANTVLLFGANIGSFSTPIGIQLAQNVLSNNAASPFMFFSILLAIIGVVFLFLTNVFYTKKSLYCHTK
ncbi:hypothetical protein JCM15457_1444 [Liquorilactobacillus sucicola DSM 21376 = JCM 15457]|uniref:MFS transporter n=1 Tax=Liquorilactobacillus sucicola TaxID=519050 RepID=UPI000434AEB9|nr:MFS transporter [Liquorilactobacillus sucicola]GAJ26514.1 hypothetical protein JCM15457_1444 [Liquorilactobacillus sucicola DSM 21376 = JCM 15457]